MMIGEFVESVELMKLFYTALCKARPDTINSDSHMIYSIPGVRLCAVYVWLCSE